MAGARSVGQLWTETAGLVSVSNSVSAFILCNLCCPCLHVSVPDSGLLALGR